MLSIFYNETKMIKKTFFQSEIDATCDLKLVIHLFLSLIAGNLLILDTDSQH